MIKKMFRFYKSNRIVLIKKNIYDNVNTVLI